jgi:hypothetical protein
MVGSASQLGLTGYEFGDRHPWYANLFPDHYMTERTVSRSESVIKGRPSDAEKLRGFAHREEK